MLLAVGGIAGIRHKAPERDRVSTKPSMILEAVQFQTELCCIALAKPVVDGFGLFVKVVALYHVKAIILRKIPAKSGRIVFPILRNSAEKP